MPIFSATPKNNALGTLDGSIRVLPPIKPNQAQFKPKFYIVAQKGTLDAIDVDGSTALLTYGEESFDKTSKYFTHATLFLKDILSAPATCVVERVVDPNVKIVSNVTVWIDIALDDIPEYSRNSDGTYVLDANGLPVQTGNTIEGYKYRIYYSSKDNNGYDPALDGTDQYKASIMQGFMTDKNGNPSTMYPISTFMATSFGEAYNFEGLTFDPMTGDEADEKLMSEEKVFPYKFSRFSTLSGVKKNISTKYGDTFVKFVFKEGTLDPTTKQPLQLEEMLPDYWENKDDPENPLMISDIAEPIIYYDNIKIVADLLFAKEAPYINTVPQTWADGLIATTSEWFDFEAGDSGASAGQELLMNILTAKSSKEINYFTFVKDDSPITLTGVSDTSISSSTVIYLNGGSDGQEITPDFFESLVVSKFDEYTDINSKVYPSALNPESIFIDSGFTVDTKLRLCNVLSQRKDIAVALSTYEWNADNKTKPISDQVAIATLLKNKLKLMPESVFFGTPTARAIIVMGSGIKVDGSYRYRVPQLLDFMIKAAKQMGAGNGKWKPGFNFSRSPLNVVDTLKDLEPNFIPESVKSILWKAGLIWTQNKDKRTWFYPSSQTVYENDTSVLNSFATIMAICTITKVHEDCWEEFSGANDLSNAELIEKVEGYMIENLKDRFDGIIETEPHCVITGDDEIRGYSWKLITYLYANNMKTVAESHIVAMRASDINNG